MFRYIIAIGNSQRPSDCDVLNDIRRRIQMSGDNWRTIKGSAFFAAHVEDDISRDAALLLHDDRGVIFGFLRRSPNLSSGAAAASGSPSVMHGISRDHSERIVESKGRSLITEYWGHYVAVIRYPECARTLVLRSPVSALPCQHLQLGTLHVFFSRVEDCIALDLTRFTVNWDCITAHVVGGDYVTRETGLEQVHSVECGECIECTTEGCTAQSYWDPRPLLANRTFQDFTEATAAIHDVTRYCVSATTFPHANILVNLSGGLDSSIVLSALSASAHRPKLTAINYYSRGCGDERRFARSMAEAVRCCLVEQPRDDSLNVRCFDDCNWTVSPALNFSAPDTERRNITLARKIGASAIVDGELGDNIFGSNVGVGALVECFRRHGIRRDFRAAAIDYAMLTRQSLWSTLVQTYREWTSLAANPDFSAAWEMRRRHTLSDARSMILASASAEEQHANTAYRFVHPWLQTSRQLAPGSYVLLLGIIMVTSSVYHSPFASPRDPPQISPLLAQPLLEIALQIPAYFHVKFGINRAVARIAFTGSLPPPILHRGTAKGGPHLWAKDVVENNVVYLRECLLDGILAQRGLLDRNKLEAVLSPRIEKSTAIVGDIFAKLYIETWLRKWQPLTLPRSVWRRAGT